MINYFEIFSLSQIFALDVELLEKKYLEFQKQFHPDNSSSRDIEQSITVNEAFEVLKNPLKRAAHILQLNGIDIEDDSNAPKVDVATLQEVLEIREKVFENSAQENEDLKKDLSKKIKSLLNEVSSNLENKEFDLAAQILIRAKYFDKTLQDLKKRAHS